MEKSIWVGFAQELYNAGLLTNLDIGTFEIYVLAYATRVRVKPHLDNALIYKGPNGGAVHNPYLAIYNKATEQMLKSGAELGLSPGSRSRISVDPPKGEESPLQQWKQKYKA